MDIFIKATSGILITVVIGVILSKHSKDYSVLLILAVCCMVSVTAMQYLARILEFIRSMEAITNLDSNLLQILFKVVGIAIITELTFTICTDSGYSALGKVIQLWAACVNLWLCTPLFDQLLELVSTVLGAI